jgi:plasmid stability protein
VVNLTVRNIPENILKRIRIFAVRERRSTNSELLILLENGLKERIRQETGKTASGEERDVSSLPLAMREQLWNELSGKWADDRSLAAVITDIYETRNGGKPV